MNAAVTIAHAALTRHYPCEACSHQRGAAGMCVEGMRRYAAYLAALARARGFDPGLFPSVRVARARGIL